MAASAVALSGGGAAQAQRIDRIAVPFGPGAVQGCVARAVSHQLGLALDAKIG